MEKKDIYQNCRNCEMRFSCNDKSEEGHRCDDYIFDEEAATCDDCGKRNDCLYYTRNKPTCVDWEPEVTCDECVNQESCKNYMEGGKICKKFKEVMYTLTQKGCLYLAMEEVHDIDKMYVDGGAIIGNGFFEELEHEMLINGLISMHKNNLFWKIVNRIKYKIFKPKTDLKKIFFEIAHKDKYFRDFCLSEKIIEAVYNRFVNILKRQYESL